MSKQLLSAAVDADATDVEWDALLEAVDRDPAIKAEWSRIWEMRDAQADVALAGSREFCLGVMAAIANEKSLPSNVVPIPLRVAGKPPERITAATVKPVRSSLSWRTLVPLSAAAGVVAAVLMMDGLRGTNGVQPAPLLTSAAATPAAPPADFNPGVVTAAADADKAAILNAYLIEHSNSQPERSMGGALANARFAARTADYRPDSH